MTPEQSRQRRREKQAEYKRNERKRTAAWWSEFREKCRTRDARKTALAVAERGKRTRLASEIAQIRWSA